MPTPHVWDSQHPVWRKNRRQGPSLYGHCAGCQERHALNSDGTVRRHTALSIAADCPGSYQRPGARC